MKKYFQLRICVGCDEQRMVDKRGYCSECNKKERLAREWQGDLSEADHDGALYYAIHGLGGDE